MAADINDKLKKYKSRFSTTLSTGIGTGTSDTLTPATVTGLPTDTAVTLFIDRVDSTGTKTPAKLEAIKGVVSGGNLTSYVRAVEGTEQAHSGGAVVEMVWNAADWNDMVDWGLEEHNQDGTHDTTKVVTPTGTQVLTNKTLTTPTLTSPVINTGVTGTALASASDVTTGTEDAKIVTPKAIKDAGIVALTKAAGSDITTGTDDAKFATSKALADAGINTRLKTKVKQISRDLSTTGGDVSYTGVGFTPSAIIAYSSLGGTGAQWGMTDSAKGALSQVRDTGASDVFTTSTGAVGSYLVIFSISSGNYVTAVVKTYDADGFTLTWGKVGSPTGTLYVSLLCFG